MNRTEIHHEGGFRRKLLFRLKQADTIGKLIDSTDSIARCPPVLQPSFKNLGKAARPSGKKLSSEYASDAALQWVKQARKAYKNGHTKADNVILNWINYKPACF